jgi:broad specificity phosphatase PhoE
MKRAAAFLVVLLAFAAASCNGTQPGSTVILIVRHAEKASDADDSPLSDAGTQRAQALAGLAADAGVSAIYTTQFKRNQETAKPLSDRTGVALTQMPVNLSNPGDYGKILARDILEKHAGQTVLVVGHANTVPLIVEGLTGKSGEAGDAAYQDIFVVIIPPSGPARMIKTRYGQPSGG